LSHDRHFNCPASPCADGLGGVEPDPSSGSGRWPRPPCAQATADQAAHCSWARQPCL